MNYNVEIKFTLLCVQIPSHYDDYNLTKTSK